MGFWERLIKGTEEKPKVNVGFIGEGKGFEELKKAYDDHPQAEIIAAEPLDRAEEVIRNPGMQAVEIFGKPEEIFDTALACIKSGIHTSVPAPVAMTIDKADEVITAAKNYEVTLRVRQPVFYYDPLIKAKDLIDKRAIGRPITLKMMLKVTDIEKPDFDRAEWLLENQTDYLALAERLFGPIEKVHARLEAEATNGVPCSNVVMWKYKEKHQYGYLQVDFSPGLHVRTFTDPVYRAIEITGTDGMMFLNRAEGQLLRQPVLFIRGKNKTTAYELLKEDWREVYPTIAKDMIKCALTHKPPRSTAQSSLRALKLALAAKESNEKGDEVSAD